MKLKHILDWKHSWTGPLSPLNFKTYPEGAIHVAYSDILQFRDDNNTHQLKQLERGPFL